MSPIQSGDFIIDKTKKIVLITGAAGFIGSALVRRYLINCYVIAVDITEPKLNFLISPNNYKYVYCDLSDDNSLNNLVENFPIPNIIIHLAGVTRVKDAAMDPNQAISRNILATSNLYLKYKNIYQKNNFFGSFLFISTAELAHILSAPNNPSVYSITKKACEDLIRSFYDERFMKTAIIRLCTVYGTESEKKDKLPRLFLEKAKSDLEIVLTYENSILPSYIYIDDCIDLIISIDIKTRNLQDKLLITYTLNGEKMSLEGLISIIENILGRKVRYRYSNLIENYSSNGNFDLKFVSLTHEKPTSLFAGLERMKDKDNESKI
jgi:nucleoside-diphosphate-sugar epimerase